MRVDSKKTISRQYQYPELAFLGCVVEHMPIPSRYLSAKSSNKARDDQSCHPIERALCLVNNIESREARIMIAIDRVGALDLALRR